jgi:streptogramin lyase
MRDLVFKQIVRSMLLSATCFLLGCGGGGSSSSAAPAGISPLLTLASAAPSTVLTVGDIQATTSPNPVLPTAAPSSVQPIVSSNTSVGNANTNSGVRVPVTVHYHLAQTPTITASGSSLMSVRRPEYISPSNTQIVIGVTPLGGSTTNYGPNACTTSSCTINFTALPGTVTLTFNLTGAAGTLSTFSTMAVIQPRGLNTLNFTANPVVKTASVQLASTSVTAGSPADISLSVNALDAAGNIISGGSQYVDSSGNPVRFTVGVTNNQAGGQGGSYLTSGSVFSSAGQTATLHYDGNWLASSTVTLSSSGGTVTSLTGAVLTTIPHAVEYPVGISPTGLALGRDGNIWIASWGSSAIGKITPAGVYTSITCAICSGPIQVARGSDGNMWFTNSGSTNIFVLNLNGTLIKNFTVPNNPLGIVSAQDGNMWFSSGSDLIGYITSSGTVNTLSGLGYSFGITVGPDRNIWYLDKDNDLIGKVSTNLKLLATYGLSGMAYDSIGIVSGPDGNIWVAENTANVIAKVTPGGVVTNYALAAGAAPRGIVVGPDNNMWFADNGDGNLGQMTTAGAITLYNTVNGISSGATLTAIIIGPDGNLWFGDGANGAIGKFVL